MTAEPRRKHHGLTPALFGSFKEPSWPVGSWPCFQSWYMVTGNTLSQSEYSTPTSKYVQTICSEAHVHQVYTHSYPKAIGRWQLQIINAPASHTAQVPHSAGAEMQHRVEPQQSTVDSMGMWQLAGNAPRPQAKAFGDESDADSLHHRLPTANSLVALSCRIISTARYVKATTPELNFRASGHSCCHDGASSSGRGCCSSWLCCCCCCWSAAKDVLVLLQPAA